MTRLTFKYNEDAERVEELIREETGLIGAVSYDRTGISIGLLSAAPVELPNGGGIIYLPKGDLTVEQLRRIAPKAHREYLRILTQKSTYPVENYYEVQEYSSNWFAPYGSRRWWAFGAATKSKGRDTNRQRAFRDLFEFLDAGIHNTKVGHEWIPTRVVFYPTEHSEPEVLATYPTFESALAARRKA